MQDAINQLKANIIARFDQMVAESSKRIEQSSGTEHVRLTAERASITAAKMIVAEEFQKTELTLQAKRKQRLKTLADWLKATSDTYSENGT